MSSKGRKNLTCTSFVSELKIAVFAAFTLGRTNAGFAQTISRHRVALSLADRADRVADTFWAAFVNVASPGHALTAVLRRVKRFTLALTSTVASETFGANRRAITT